MLVALTTDVDHALSSRECEVALNASLDRTLAKIPELLRPGESGIRCFERSICVQVDSLVAPLRSRGPAKPANRRRAAAAQPRMRDRVERQV